VSVEAAGTTAVRDSTAAVVPAVGADGRPTYRQNDVRSSRTVAEHGLPGASVEISR
jgi:hypothetical protein